LAIIVLQVPLITQPKIFALAFRHMFLFPLFDVPTHPYISSVWFHYDQRHGCSRKQTRLPVVSIGELRGESELMRVCLNFKLRLRISALIALSLCLFFRLSCLNDVNGSRAHGSEPRHNDYLKRRACMNRDGEYL